LKYVLKNKYYKLFLYPSCEHLYQTLIFQQNMYTIKNSVDISHCMEKFCLRNISYITLPGIWLIFFPELKWSHTRKKKR